jgi:hypothetical protein
MYRYAILVAAISMRFSVLATNFVVTPLIIASFSSPTFAVRLADGTVAFEKSPRLVDLITTYNGVRVWGAKYYFTLELPDRAGEPLQKVAIAQREGVDDIKFYTEETFAFIGTPEERGKALNISAISKEQKNQELIISFDPPITPGTVFTIGLKPKRNPDFSGVYLFGVTAFPLGDKPYPLYLGAGRLHFYDGDSKFILP